MHEETIEESPEPAASAPDAGSDEPPGRRPPLGRPTRGRHVGATVLSALGVLVVVAVLAGFLIHLPYVIISPGSPTPLDDSVDRQIEGAQTYPHDGDLLFLTVRVSTHDPNVWRVVTCWLDSDRDVVERTKVVGCLSRRGEHRDQHRLMEQSQDDATHVALDTARVHGAGRSAGDDRDRGVPAACRRTASCDRATRSLAIDGNRSPTQRGRHRWCRRTGPGDVAAVTYARDGTTEDHEVTAGRVGTGGSGCTPTGARARGTTCLGIMAQ